MRDLSDSTSLVGVFGHARAARLVARGLRALGHRGGACAGVVAVGDDTLSSRRVASTDFLLDEPGLDALTGDVAIGARFGRGVSDDVAAGLVDPPRVPAAGRLTVGPVALAWSGVAVGAAALRTDALAHGAVLGGSDSLDEVLLHGLARSSQRTLVNRLVDALWKAPGAFSVIVAAPGLLVGARDPYGLRPLVLGRVDGASVLASEEAAVVALGGHVVRAVEPGEMVICERRGLASVRPFARRPRAVCAQESLQLAASGSAVEGRSVWELRRSLGEELAREAGASVDVVVTADDVSAPASVGFASVAGVPLLPAWAPDGRAALPEVVAGRKVALVSLAASARLRDRVIALLSAGASEVHLRVATPRRQRVCPYGVAGEDVVVEGTDTWAARLGVTTAAALGSERTRVLLKVEAGARDELLACTGCFGGAWPLADVFEAEGPTLFAP